MNLSEVYNQQKDRVFNHVLRVVKNVHNAEEITNDVFLKLHKYPYNPENEKGASLESWIITITNSVVFDFFRSNKKHQVLNHVNGYTDESGKESFDFVAPVSTNADKSILTGETQQQIVAAFHKLKPKYRRVASLYFISGKKYSEIATMLNVPEGTVKGMLNRARAKLQESLKVAQMA